MNISFHIFHFDDFFLQENALIEPQNMEMDEQLENSLSSNKVNDEDYTSHQAEKFETVHEVIPKESYGIHFISFKILIAFY